MPSSQRVGDLPYSRWPRTLRAAVAGIESAGCAAAAVGFVVAGTGGGVLVTSLTLAVVALAVAAGLALVAWAFAHGQRWPTGVFVTVQLLIAVIAVSQGARAVLSVAEHPVAAGLTLLSVLLAVAGLVSVGLGERPAVGTRESA